MLDVDPPGVASLKVAGELFIPGRRLERIGHENIKKLGSLRLQVAPFELPCILLVLSGKDDFVRFLDVFSGTGTISFTEKTQPEYLFRTLLPQCVSIMARLP